MIRKKGIAFKTFVFTSLIITLVVVLSFSILYYVLPDYYLYTKGTTLERETQRLVALLRGAETEEECRSLISDFAIKNNSDVLAFDGDDQMLAHMSSPIIRVSSITGGKIFNIAIAEVETGDENIGWYSQAGVAIEAEPLVPFADTVETKMYIAEAGDRFYSNTAVIDNGIVGYITVNATFQPIGEAKNVILSLIPYLIAVDILIALIAAYFYAGKLTRPVLKISGAAESMRRLEPGVRSAVATNDEYGQLSHNLDCMYEDLCVNIEELRAEMDKVNRLEQSKTDFMRSAGHELKTPLAALNGILEGMADNIGVYKNRDKYLIECKRLVDRLSALVSEILNASRLDNVEASAPLEDVSAELVIESALAAHQVLIDSKNLHIYKENIGLGLFTNEALFSAALMNLISNAVKYTPAGGSIFIRYDDAARVLSVENECDAILDEHIERLFEPFYTLDYSRDRERSGTGLGLYIAKKNLEYLNIGIKAENTEQGVRISLSCL